MERRAAFATVFGVFVAGVSCLASGAFAQTAPGLAGQVTSTEEGAMEGVVVSAQMVNSPITITVVTDSQGRYRIPADRLAAGKYALRIRASGYDLDGKPTADITPAAPATMDLKLKKTRNLAAQITGTEWLLSMPGSEAQKSLLLRCVSCHTLNRPTTSTHDGEEFTQTLSRMFSYAQVSFPLIPQQKVVDPALVAPERFRALGAYLSTINLSAGDAWSYDLKTIPRVKGRSSNVIITEYDLPRKTIQPHDVIFKDGFAWYTDFGEQYLGKLDPKTGKVTEFPIPVLKPDAAKGNLDLEVNADGTFWIGMMYQGGYAKFDPKTEKFEVFNLPAGVNSDVAQVTMIAAQRASVDGKMWIDDAGPEAVHRLDMKTGRYDTIAPYKEGPKGVHVIYGIFPDSKNNLYYTDFGAEEIGKIDAKTGEVTRWKTPTPNSQPRRGKMDDQDRLWFAEYRGNKIGMFDTKTEKFQEWALPTPWSSPYDVTWDRNGELWTGGMTSDRIIRLNPTTGETVEYPMSRDTNVRRVFIDDSTPRPTLWTGANHSAYIAKIEPLD